MHGRGRVLAAVKRWPADRPPVGWMGLDDNVGAGMRRLLGLSPDSDLEVALGIDMRGISPAYVGPEFPWKPEGRRRSFFGSSHKTYSDRVLQRPLAAAETVADVERFHWPTLADYDLSDVRERYATGCDLALDGPGWTPTFSQLCELFGMEAALLNMSLRPALIEAAAEHITALICDLARALHAASGGHLLIFKTADDVASQRGMMFSPAMWRRFFKPGLARQFQVARKLGLLTMFHSCGDVSQILPDLADMGLDILEPTQAHLPGMSPQMLKREYGGAMTFFGGVSTQTTLTQGSPQDVRREVEERIRVLGRGGGYIVSPDHAILDNVPPENVLALYQAAGSLQPPPW